MYENIEIQKQKRHYRRIYIYILDVAQDKNYKGVGQGN